MKINIDKIDVHTLVSYQIVHNLIFLLEYHNSLVEHGVTDYDWPKFLHDLEMALVELAIITIDLCNTMKPETFMKIMCKISGEEKAEGMIKIFEDT